MKLKELLNNSIKYPLNTFIKRPHFIYSYEIWWLKDNYKWLSEIDIKSTDWEIVK
jgi:hypothetical protein